MNKRALGISVGMVAVMLAAAAVPAVAAEPKFSLAGLVPADAFICVAARHNPERQFLDEYWGEVFDELRKCGIGEDVMALISGQLAADQIAEVERLKTLAKDLIAGVDWKQLGGDEFVFAERMVILGNAADGFHIVMPDIVWMLRGSGDGAAKNYDGLVAILETLIDEITKASGAKGLAVEKTERDGDRIAALRIDVPNGPTFSFSIALHQNIIVIALGDQMFNEVLGLAHGQKTVKALTDTPRFQAAFAGFPAAEDTMTFFDMQAMLQPIREMVDSAIRVENRSKDVIINSHRSGEAYDLSMQAWRLYEDKEYQKGLELVQQAYAIAPTDSRVLYYLACFHALTGDNQKALDFLTQSVDAGFYSPRHIARDPDLESIRDTDGYRAALAKATELAATNRTEADSAIFGVVGRLMDVPAMIDFVATSERTEGYAVKSDTRVALVAGAEKMPFYPVFGGAAPEQSFDRFLPQETLSFSVGGGIDLPALYTFIEDTFHVAGADGDKAWAEWAQIQQKVGIDVRKDVIGWIKGNSASVTLANGGGSVFMLEVSDEQFAKEKVNAAVEFLAKQMAAGATQNPMLGMLAVRRVPLNDARLEGFESLYFGMQQIVWGAAEGHLMFGTSADAVALCLKTARGEHPNIRQNAQAMSEAVLPEGKYVCVSLTDQRALGKELSGAIAGISMVSGMMGFMAPPEAQPIITKVAGMLAKLTPVVAKIDFYKSMASCTTFDGKAWHTRAVTNYAAPEERPTAITKQSTPTE